MKFTVLIDETCEQTLHASTLGNAFALDLNKKFALFGGRSFSSLVNLNAPNEVIKQFNLKNNIKWTVTNYEWDPLSTEGNERFLQTRNKLVEIVNSETSDVTVLNGHARSVNNAKWSPFKKNLLATSSADCNIFLWSTESPKPTTIIPSVGEPDCLSWNKLRNKENVLAVSCNNDIRIYDIRKTSSALRYISNAHMKKIYSLDWCANDEILLSSSRDRNIKLWNFNMRNQKFMDKILEDFPCWKAKFTPYGLCFAVTPTCLLSPKVFQYTNENVTSPDSTFTKFPFTDLNNTMNQKPKNNRLDTSQENFSSSLIKGDHDFTVSNIENVHSVNNSFSHKTANINTKNDPTTSLLVCQITSLEEAKIYKFTTNQTDMILDYDFYPQDDKFKIVSWSQNQNILQYSMDLTQLKLKELDKSTFNQTSQYKEDINSLKSTNVNNQASNPNTSNNSHTNSLCGTPPSNITSLLTNRMVSDRVDSINLNDLGGHDFLRRNPKCFGAKFTGLPEQFIVFPNIKLNSGKANNENSNTQFGSTKRARSQSKNKDHSKSMYGKHMSKRTQSKIYIYDVSSLLHITKEFAELYQISELNLKTICEQNIATAMSLKRFDVVRIWELIKFVTFNNTVKFSLNPDHGRPWPCSTFGRPLVTNIIENCIKINDIQFASMIISKLKQHDMSMIPNASTVNRRGSMRIERTLIENSTDNKFTASSFRPETSKPRNIVEYRGNTDIIKHHQNLGLLDPNKLNEFDAYLKSYCEILYQWSLYNKRIEMLEFICEKPPDYDDKFECEKNCYKCIGQVNNSKCTHTLKCSICRTPVNGLSVYCVMCGHGGHYDHLIDWFKRHEDCPNACGCRCIDYLCNA